MTSPLPADLTACAACLATPSIFRSTARFAVPDFRSNIPNAPLPTARLSILRRFHARRIILSDPRTPRAWPPGSARAQGHRRAVVGVHRLRAAMISASFSPSHLALLPLRGECSPAGRRNTAAGRGRHTSRTAIILVCDRREHHATEQDQNGERTPRRLRRILVLRPIYNRVRNGNHTDLAISGSMPPNMGSLPAGQGAVPAERARFSSSVRSSCSVIGGRGGAGSGEHTERQGALPPGGGSG